MPIDYSTDIGKVRNLINDVDEANFVFEDDRITSFLEIAAGESADETIYGAAALALYAMVQDHAINNSESLRVYTLSINKKNIPESLLALAKKYTEMATSAGGGMTINQLVVTDPVLADWIDNKIDFDQALTELGC